MLGRRFVYCFGIDENIEAACASCQTCKLVNFRGSPELLPWPKARYPFERVHEDFCKWTILAVLEANWSSDVSVIK